MDNNNGDLLNLVSILIGLQNLQENREQSEHNDIQSANDNQTKFLLDELNKKFDEQNKMLNEILQILKKQEKHLLFLFFVLKSIVIFIFYCYN